MENEIKKVYAKQFQKCLTYTLMHLKENPQSPTELNIGIVQDYFKKAGGEISVVSLRELNELERKFGMEVTQ